MVLKSGGNFVLPANAFILNKEIVLFCELRFDVVLFPYAFVCSSDSVPNFSMYGFAKNCVQYAVTSKG